MTAPAHGLARLDENPAMAGASFADIRAATGRGRDRLEPLCRFVLDIDHSRNRTKLARPPRPVIPTEMRAQR